MRDRGNRASTSFFQLTKFLLRFMIITVVYFFKGCISIPKSIKQIRYIVVMFSALMSMVYGARLYYSFSTFKVPVQSVSDIMKHKFKVVGDNASPVFRYLFQV